MKLPLIATRRYGSTKLFVHKNSPTILTGVGILGFIATTALTARSTVKALDKLPQISEGVAEVKERTVHGHDTCDECYSSRDKTRDLVKVYASSSMDLFEVYWPPLVVGSASIVCLLSAHGMMLKRQANLLAAYTALDAGYKAYRARVREAVGEENEEILYRTVKTTTSFDEAGQSCQIEDKDDTSPSPYARFFDETSPNWSKTPEYNLLFLRAQQQWANDKLRAFGFLFLNEVYEGLGLERSQAGQVVGWKMSGKGDGHVDFGLYAAGDDGHRDFINLLERTVLLDFNVDGPITI